MSRIIQATQYEVEIWLRIIQKVKDEKLKIIIITISTDCNDLKNQWIICTFTHKFVEIVLNKLINWSMRLDFENVIQTEQIKAVQDIIPILYNIWWHVKNVQFLDSYN